MPYTIPTRSQFRTKFPTFAAVSDASVDAAILETSASVDTSWIAGDYQPAILYLAAHILVADGALTAASGLGDAAGVISVGLVSEMKVGDVQVKLSGSAGSGASAASASGLRSTTFGQRYLDLLRRNQPAVALV